MEPSTGTTRKPLPPALPGSFPLCADYGRDVPETWLREVAPVVLDILLADRTTGKNICWCADDYAARGDGYGFADEITADRVCGPDPVIRPRVDKRLEEQKARVAAKGEVFTPAWVCNAQNNLVDQAWFGLRHKPEEPVRPIFTIEEANGWKPTDDESLIQAFKASKHNSGEYISIPRLEVCCGEAPYLTSRYDAASGEIIPVPRRIGLLDRKLRVISLRPRNPNNWIADAISALKSLYAYDWQGDNVLLARENLLFATLEAFAARWPDVRLVSTSVVESLAAIISWNVFQMDGVKCVVPGTCHDETPPPAMQDIPGLDDGSPGGLAPPRPRPCPGCASGSRALHNGVRPVVIDWAKSDFEPRSTPFHQLFPKP